MVHFAIGSLGGGGGSSFCLLRLFLGGGGGSSFCLLRLFLLGGGGDGDGGLCPLRFCVLVLGGGGGDCSSRLLRLSLDSYLCILRLLFSLPSCNLRLTFVFWAFALAALAPRVFLA